jgi:hypothetical protein
MPTPALEVGDPQPIWRLMNEHPLDQVCRRGSFVTPGARQALDDRTGHQHLDLIVADPKPQSESQLGMNSASAVRAPRGGVHGVDLLGEPGMADRPRRGWPGAPCVVTRLGHLQQPTCHLHGKSLCGHGDYGRVPSFGSCGSFSSSRVLFRMATSVSNSRMRLLAGLSSASSARFSPDSCPVSISSWRRQR